MRFWTPIKYPFKKSVAIVTGLAFLFQVFPSAELAQAAIDNAERGTHPSALPGSEYFLADPPKAGTPAQAQNGELNILYYQLHPPTALGRIVDYYNADLLSSSFTVHRSSFPAPFVILIQDLHVNASVQDTIAKLLEFYEKQGILPEQIHVEGAQGLVDSSLLAAIPDKDLKEEVCQDLLKSGDLTGMEYYAAKAGKPYLLYGVENDEYYTVHRKLFQKSFATRTELAQSLQTSEQTLAAFHHSTANRAMKRLAEWKKDYTNGKLSLSNYFNRLENLSKKSGISLDNDYPALSQLRRLLASEKDAKRLDSKQIKSVTEQILVTLHPLLKPEEKDLLATLAQRDSSLYYSYLADLLDVHGSRTTDHGTLRAFLAYQRLFRQTNMAKVDLELGRLAHQLALREANTEVQKNLITLERDLSLLKRLLENQLTQEELLELGPRVDQISNTMEKLFIATPSPLGGRRPTKKEDESGDGRESVSAPAASAEGWGEGSRQQFERSLQASLDFYAMAMLRDKPMVEQTLQRLNNVQSTEYKVPSEQQEESLSSSTSYSVHSTPHAVAVLVAGGFHTSGISELLKQQGISYLTISSTVESHTKVDSELYIKKLLGPEKQTLSLYLADPEQFVVQLQKETEIFHKKFQDPLRVEAILHYLAARTKERVPDLSKISESTTFSKRVIKSLTIHPSQSSPASVTYSGQITLYNGKLLDWKVDIPQRNKLPSETLRVSRKIEWRDFVLPALQAAALILFVISIFHVRDFAYASGQLAMGAGLSERIRSPKKPSFNYSKPQRPSSPASPLDLEKEFDQIPPRVISQTFQNSKAFGTLQKLLKNPSPYYDDIARAAVIAKEIGLVEHEVVLDEEVVSSLIYTRYEPKTLVSNPGVGLIYYLSSLMHSGWITNTTLTKLPIVSLIIEQFFNSRPSLEKESPYWYYPGPTKSNIVHEAAIEALKLLVDRRILNKKSTKFKPIRETLLEDLKYPQGGISVAAVKTLATLKAKKLLREDFFISLQNVKSLLRRINTFWQRRPDQYAEYLLVPLQTLNALLENNLIRPDVIERLELTSFMIEGLQKANDEWVGYFVQGLELLKGKGFLKEGEVFSQARVDRLISYLDSEKYFSNAQRSIPAKVLAFLSENNLSPQFTISQKTVDHLKKGLRAVDHQEVLDSAKALAALQRAKLLPVGTVVHDGVVFLLYHSICTQSTDKGLAFAQALGVLKDSGLIPENAVIPDDMVEEIVQKLNTETGGEKFGHLYAAKILSLLKEKHFIPSTTSIPEELVKWLVDPGYASQMATGVEAYCVLKEAGFIDTIPFERLEQFYERLTTFSPYAANAQKISLLIRVMLEVKGQQISNACAQKLQHIVKDLDPLRPDYEKTLQVLLDDLVFLTHQKSDSAQSFLEDTVRAIGNRQASTSGLIEITAGDRLFIQAVMESHRALSLRPLLTKPGIPIPVRASVAQKLAELNVIDGEYAALVSRDADGILSCVTKFYGTFRDIPPAILAQKISTGETTVERIEESKKELETIMAFDNSKEILSALAGNREMLLAYYCFHKSPFEYPGAAPISYDRFEKLIKRAHQLLAKVDDRVVTEKFKGALQKTGLAQQAVEQVIACLTKGGPPLSHDSPFMAQGRFVPQKIDFNFLIKGTAAQKVLEKFDRTKDVLKSLLDPSRERQIVRKLFQEHGHFFKIEAKDEAKDPTWNNLDLSGLEKRSKKVINELNKKRREGKLTPEQKAILGKDNIQVRHLINLFFHSLSKVVQEALLSDLQELNADMNTDYEVYMAALEGVPQHVPTVYLDYADKRNLFELLQFSDGAHCCNSSDPKISSHFAQPSLYERNAPRWMTDTTTIFFQVTTAPRGGKQVGWLKVWLGIKTDGTPFIGSNYLYLHPSYQDQRLANAIVSQVEKIFSSINIPTYAQADVGEGHVPQNAMAPPQSYSRTRLEKFIRLQALKSGGPIQADVRFQGNKPISHHFFCKDSKPPSHGKRSSTTFFSIVFPLLWTALTLASWAAGVGDGGAAMAMAVPLASEELLKREYRNLIEKAIATKGLDPLLAVILWVVVKSGKTSVVGAPITEKFMVSDLLQEDALWHQGLSIIENRIKMGIEQGYLRSTGQTYAYGKVRDAHKGHQGTIYELTDKGRSLIQELLHGEPFPELTEVPEVSFLNSQSQTDVIKNLLEVIVTGNKISEAGSRWPYGFTVSDLLRLPLHSLLLFSGSKNRHALLRMYLRIAVENGYIEDTGKRWPSAGSGLRYSIYRLPSRSPSRSLSIYQKIQDALDGQGMIKPLLRPKPRQLMQRVLDNRHNPKGLRLVELAGWLGVKPNSVQTYYGTSLTLLAEHLAPFGISRDDVARALPVPWNTGGPSVGETPFFIPSSPPERQELPSNSELSPKIAPRAEKKFAQDGPVYAAVREALARPFDEALTDKAEQNLDQMTHLLAPQEPQRLREQLERLRNDQRLCAFHVGECRKFLTQGSPEEHEGIRLSVQYLQSLVGRYGVGRVPKAVPDILAKMAKALEPETVEEADRRKKQQAKSHPSLAPPVSPADNAVEQPPQAPKSRRQWKIEWRAQMQIVREATGPSKKEKLDQLYRDAQEFMEASDEPLPREVVMFLETEYEKLKQAEMESKELKGKRGIFLPIVWLAVFLASWATGAGEAGAVLAMATPASFGGDKESKRLGETASLRQALTSFLDAYENARQEGNLWFSITPQAFSKLYGLPENASGRMLQDLAAMGFLTATKYWDRLMVGTPDQSAREVYGLARWVQNALDKDKDSVMEGLKTLSLLDQSQIPTKGPQETEEEEKFDVLREPVWALRSKLTDTHCLPMDILQSVHQGRLTPEQAMLRLLHNSRWQLDDDDLIDLEWAQSKHFAKVLETWEARRLQASIKNQPVSKATAKKIVEPLKGMVWIKSELYALGAGLMIDSSLAYMRLMTFPKTRHLIFDMEARRIKAFGITTRQVGPGEHLGVIVLRSRESLGERILTVRIGTFGDITPYHTFQGKNYMDIEQDGLKTAVTSKDDVRLIANRANSGDWSLYDLWSGTFIPWEGLSDQPLSEAAFSKIIDDKGKEILLGQNAKGPVYNIHGKKVSRPEGGLGTVGKVFPVVILLGALWALIAGTNGGNLEPTLLGFLATPALAAPGDLGPKPQGPRILKELVPQGPLLQDVDRAVERIRHGQSLWQKA